MNWTVSRRIIAGFTVALLLLATVASIGLIALKRTGGGYGDALRQERQVLMRAVEARGALQSANIEYLRFLVEEETGFVERRDSAIAAARTLFGELTTLDPPNATAWRTAEQQLDSWRQLTGLSIAAAQRNDVSDALTYRSDAQTTRRVLEEGVDAALQDLRERTDAATVAAEETSDASEGLIALALGFGLLLMALSGYLLNRAVSRPLEETSSVLGSSAAQIVSATAEQASGATESMAAVTETAATVDEVVQTAEQAAERARAVASSAQRAVEISRQGRDAVEQSGAAMDQVRTQVSSIGASILELAEQAQAIGEIITTVNDLAEQTNLLALNAAIEAARAGEHGRGFSVVAGEVRGLAEQSKSATVRVRQILGEIQRATASAVMSTEQGNKQVEEGSRQVKEAGDTIRQLAEAIQGAAQAAAQISASAGQQSTGMAQIKQAVGSIQQAAQQNLAATRESESAAQELNRVGAQLVALIGTRRTGR